jgi:hypothetical protein
MICCFKTAKFSQIIQYPCHPCQYFGIDVAYGLQVNLSIYVLLIYGLR